MRRQMLEFGVVITAYQQENSLLLIYYPLTFFVNILYFHKDCKVPCATISVTQMPYNLFFSVMEYTSNQKYQMHFEDMTLTKIN